jgi:PAS domain S-box-containing protein
VAVTDPKDLFAWGGEVGRDLARVDWAATPLGPPRTWPQSLVSAVRVVLTSRFSMWMAWGPDLTFFCNEAYRRDTLGRKYPWALGRPASEVWAEIWPDIGPRIERVMTTGEATWDEALQLFLERSGYREETYHTFSYSPLTDDEGDVVGMLCVVSEETERVIGARQMTTVRDVTAHVTASRSEAEVLSAAAVQLSADLRSVPFALVYLVDGGADGHLDGGAGGHLDGDADGRLDGDATPAVLGLRVGVPAGHPTAPDVLDPADAAAPWPAAEVLEGRTVLVDDLPARFADLPTGAWPEPPTQALLVPLRRQDAVRPLGFLVAAVNRYRRLDADYRGFLELLADQIATALTGARAYREERERAERLLELDRAKTQFFTNVSHEFRTPLTLLLGPTEDALGDSAHPVDDVQRERLELVRRNGERLLRLVNTLLDFSRLEAGAGDGRFEPVDLARYTAELAESFSGAVRRAGLKFTVDCPALPSPAYVDREMWAKIVLNLLSNAVKFTFTGGVTVRLREDGGEAVLDVEDTGVGVPADAQATLFRRFTRVAGTDARSFEGSGIGLALVADLAAVHGGRVGLRSTAGAGSTFTVVVPLGRDHLPAGQVEEAAAQPDHDAGRRARGYLAEALRWTAHQDGAEPAAGVANGVPAAGALVPGQAGGAGHDGDRPRVLVADDNSDMRDYIAGLLGGDYEVLLAADGGAALELARTQAPDLVLSDVMMPRVDGFGLLRALRADPLTARTPVVLVSARAGEEATVDGLDAGADDYLVKPFSGRELVARVRANVELERVRRSRRDLERSQALLDQTERMAKVGSWEIDLASGAIVASAELARQVHMAPEELARPGGVERIFAERTHPDDRDRIRGVLEQLVRTGEPVDDEQRLVLPSGEVRVFHVLAEVQRDAQGGIVRVRGSNQDITEQREAELALSAAAAAAEAAAREHAIATELQRGLLPDADVQAEALRLATYYRAGVEGTQVGGDWYDVVQLGAQRTALVLGDVMGRGVRAAAVMGQLRSAVRAYARLDLPPAEILEHLDGVVRELGDDQIVTCVYAVFDPYDRVLSYANAGHLPPMLRFADGAVRQLHGAQSPPLGALTGPLAEHRVALEPGDVLALYTDGLVEHRDSDIDEGLAALAARLGALHVPLHADAPDGLVASMLPGGPDDDVAVLLAQVAPSALDSMVSLKVRDDVAAVHETRHAAAAVLEAWSIDRTRAEETLLVLSELTTNALLHGRPPAEVRISRGERHVTLEVHDSATTVPRRAHPGNDDEHGRGLLLVSLLAERWGTRPTPEGKAVWCILGL